MSNRTAVVTVVFGERYEKIAEITCPKMQHYAKKHGHDFVVINKVDYRISNRGLHAIWQKYQVKDLLTDYSSILFVDSDVLVRPDAPDLVEMSEGRFAAVNEMPFFDQKNPKLDLVERVYQFCDGLNLPQPPNVPLYVNIGVFVIHRHFRHLLNVDARLDGHPDFLGEQNYLNYQLIMERVPVLHLSPIFNMSSDLMRFPDWERMTYFYHAAGIGEKEEMLGGMLEKWGALGLL